MQSIDEQDRLAHAQSFGEMVIIMRRVDDFGARGCCVACSTASPFDLQSAGLARHQAASGSEIRPSGNMHGF
jgi:hypothetical protein